MKGAHLYESAMQRDGRRGGVKGGYSAVTIDYKRRHQLQQSNEGYGSDVRSGWPKGLANVGNTCYANATLQCLLSTALSNALIDPKTVPIFRRYSSNPNLLALGSGSVDSGEPDCDTPKCEDEEKRKEREKRRMHDKCEWLTKELTRITREYHAASDAEHTPGTSVMGWLSQQTSSDVVVDPGSVTKHPDRLSTCLRPYQQEDAHEFLRALLGTLVMNGHNKELSSLFDGLLESAVTCKTCGRASLTRDRYMDLSLDINDPELTTLEDALYEYTKTEILEEDNAVFCQKCQKKRAVTKGLRLATAPSILVCHLKRFAFNGYGRMVRLHKKVKYPQRLEIGDFMSNLNNARPPPYGLVGVLVHQGQTCASGHYLSFVKKHGEWFQCNDSVVTKVDEATVMDQQAYILMYEVAEMREKTGKVRSKHLRQFSAPQMGADESEILKEDRSTQGSLMSSETSRYTFNTPDDSTEAPVSKLLQLLSKAEGNVKEFFSDLCCDSDAVNEPQTQEMKRQSSRRDRRRNSESFASQEIRRNSSSEGIQVFEVDRKQGGRAQTAPRQRMHSYDFAMEAGPSLVSPAHTAHSARSASGNHKGKKKSKSRKLLRARSRTRLVHKLAENRALPPLPHSPDRRRRAKSYASSRRPGGFMV